MNIGDAAQASGISAKMIRYYERIGLMHARGRTEGGYRIYTHEEIETLRFIRQARKLGFPLEQIQKLLALWQDRERASAEVKALALEHLRELDARIAELEAMRDVVAHLADHCAGDDRPCCPILDGLSHGGEMTFSS